MAEIDPIILELRADVEKFRADIRQLTNDVTTRFGVQERSVQRLERQMQQSSAQIGNAFRSIAVAFAGAFSVAQIQQLADGYTRFTNQLKVTGLEGKSLAATQESLFQIAQKYGTELESVGTLYSRAAQSSVELNASQGDLLATTEAVAASLKISGTSAAQAQGALLQLGQALGSPRIQAEEFNSLLDTMQPLLREVAKRIDGTGGTIGGLTRKIKDLKGEGVSNVEFFRAINDSLEDLQKTAAASTLTLGNSFTVLNNALGKYIGETDQALSATEQLSGAIIKISENLDTIIPALAAIIGLIGTRYVAALAASVAGTIGLNAASLALAVSLNGVGAAAALVGTRLLAAFGGPIGAAVIALGAGLAYVASQSGVAAKATGEYAKQADALAKIQDKVTDATDRLASATGKARAEALANAKALREETKQYLANAQAALIAAQAKAIEVREKARQELTSLPVNSGAGGGPDRLNGVLQRNSRQVIDANANAKAAEAAVIGFQKELIKTQKIIDAAAPPNVAPVGDGKPDKKTRTATAQEDPLEKIFRAAQDELAAQLEIVQAKRRIALEAGERGELERDALNIEAQIRDNEISEALRKKEITKDVADTARKNLAQLYGQVQIANEETGISVRAAGSLYGIAVAREERLQAEEEAAAIIDAQTRAQSDALRQQYDLAKSQTERRDLALQIIDLEDRSRIEALRRIQLDEDLYDAKTRQIAAIDEAAILESRARREEAARRDTAGPLENYFDRAKMDAEELNEAYQQIAVDGLGSVTNALAETATGFLKLGGVAGRVIDGIISDLIRLFIQQQITGLLGNLFGGGSTGDGAPGNAGGMDLRGFGRASGGYVAPGQTVRVNEHRGGAEYLRMGSSGGEVIPLGRVNQVAAQPMSARQGPIELRVYADRGAFISDVEAISEGQAVKVTMAAAGPLTERAVQETMRRANRPRMPGAGR